MGDSNQEEEEYIVEKIVGKRVRNGAVEYLLKWKDYPEDQNTWEPEKCLNCIGLVHEFEANRAKDLGLKYERPQKSAAPQTAAAHRGRPRSKPEDKPQMARNRDQNVKPKPNLRSRAKTGFDQGLVPEEVLGATNTPGFLNYLVKWRGVEKATLVPSSVASVKCPQLVIKYLQSKVAWE